MFGRGEEILIILILAGILFGAKKLPELGRNVGEGLREFKRSLTPSEEHTTPPAPPQA